MSYRRRRSSGGGLAGALSTLYASQNAQRGAAMNAESRIEAANIGAQGAMDRAVLGSETQLATAKMRLQGQLEKAAMDQDYKRSYLSFLKDKLSVQEKREWAKLIDLAEYRKGQLKIGAWGKQNQAEYNKILAFGKEEMARHNRVGEIVDFEKLGQKQQEIGIQGFEAETRRGKAIAEIPNIEAQTALNTAKAQAYPGESKARVGQMQANTDWTKQRPGLAKARMGVDLKKTQMQEQGKQGRLGVTQAGITQRATASQLAKSQANYFRMYEQIIDTFQRSQDGATVLENYKQTGLLHRFEAGELDGMLIDVAGGDEDQAIAMKNEIEELLRSGEAIDWSQYGIDDARILSIMAEDIIRRGGFIPKTKKGAIMSPADVYLNPGGE